MTMLLRSLLLGFGVATSAAAWLFASGVSLWAVLLFAWFGGNVLGLAIATLGAWIWPVAPAWQPSSIGHSEFRLWDQDLAHERVDAELMKDVEPMPGVPTRQAS